MIKKSGVNEDPHKIIIHFLVGLKTPLFTQNGLNILHQ